MAHTDSIRVVNLHLRDHIAQHSCAVPSDSVAKLVQDRFGAKFEVPSSTNAALRRKTAWLRWIELDEGIPSSGILGPYWAKARLLCHQFLRGYRLGELTFTNGSSFVPLGDATTIACKLDGPWTVTSDCFDLFCRLSYRHRALKHAVKKRFKCYCTRNGWNERTVNRKLWMRFRNCKDCAFQIYGFKLFCSVTFVRGNRYSTVPKNNLKDRSICLEPLCNMLVQRAVGLGLRRCLKDNLGIDLDTLADVHRARISANNCATIDLSDCSDTIGMRLINYLIPRRPLNDLQASRSDMTFGPDDNYHVVAKVSSMGNGFTFDLMSLVLTALARSIDETATVFGDDIVCQNQYADAIVDNLRVAGFIPNEKKTLIRSSYRESCGAHYMDGHGYVTAFDIRWIHDLGDLIVTCNKVAILSAVYGEPYETLRRKIWVHLPKVLLGCTTDRLVVDVGRPPSYILDKYVRYGPIEHFEPNKHTLRKIRKFCAHTQKSGKISIALACENRNTLRSKDRLRSTDWAIFYQYVQSGRRTPYLVRSALKTSQVARVDEEQVDLVSALLPKG